MKEYYQKHRAELLQKRHDDYMADPMPKRERERQRRKTNRTSILQYLKDWRARNHEANLQKKREAYQANADQLRAAKRERYASDPSARAYAKMQVKKRKALIRGGQAGYVSPDQWEALKARYGYRCLRCGRSDVELTQDHVIPLSKGGKHDINNIQPLCRTCNSSKYTGTKDYRNASFS